MSKIIVEPSSQLADEQIEFISKFCIFCEDECKTLGSGMKVVLTGDATKHKIKTTAYFNPGTRTMVVLALGRHQVDICRSIAHEMVHLRQSMNDFFGVQEIPDVGGFFEDEANAVAGQIVKKFIAY